MVNSSNLQMNCQQYGVIYKIENLLNGKCYIGQTIDFNRRISEHKRGNKQVVDKAIQKYGFENFSFEIIETCKRELLNEREIYWIKFFDCKVPTGYNLTDGGDGTLNPIKSVRKKFSESAKKRIPWNKGKSSPLKGKPRSEETKAKISATKRNKKNSNHGL